MKRRAVHPVHIQKIPACIISVISNMIKNVQLTDGLNKNTFPTDIINIALETVSRMSYTLCDWPMRSGQIALERVILNLLYMHMGLQNTSLQRREFYILIKFDLMDNNKILLM
jgi:hypothetical protein